MASSSATTARPQMDPFSVTIILTSNRSNDTRTIQLSPGKTVQLGRASRSGFKDRYVSHDNAMFDCPVVSRDHAELRYSAWQEHDKQITITDCSSLHGTAVNGKKLLAGKDYNLRSGDVIELGDKVTRAEESHEGISLTFRRNDVQLYSYQPRNQSPIMNRGFQVPDSPEHDISDYHSEVESDPDGANHFSSAKTTPEQPKYKLGTQKSPIDLDVAAGPSMIDLSREEDEEADDAMVMSAASAAHRNDEIIIPETYDEDRVPLLSESVPIIPESAAEDVEDQAVALSQVQDRESSPAYATSEHNSDDNYRMHYNTGLAQILSERDGTPDRETAHDEADVNGESEDDDDEIEYGGYDSLEDGDNQSDSIAEEVGDFDAEPESDYEPADYQPEDAYRTERSPQHVNKTSSIHDILSNEHAKPHYDPIRGSHPASTVPTTTYTSATSSTPYTYDYYGFGAPLAQPVADYYNSTRWDMQPTGSYGSFVSSYLPTVMQSAPTSYGPPLGYNSTTAPGPVTTSTAASNFGTDLLAYQTLVPSSAASDAQAAPASRFNVQDVQQSSDKSSSKTKRKIDITDIVENNTIAVPDIPKTPADMLKQARQMVEAANTPNSSTTSPGATKRKACQIEDNTEENIPKSAAKKSKAEATIAHPASRQTKRERRLLRTFIRTAATGATGAAFGAVATVAFLSSSYAQSLIDYLA